MKVLANSFLDMNQPERAIKYFDQLIYHEPGNDDYLLKRGICKYKLDKPDEAMADWRKCIALNPSNKSVSSYISNILNEQNDRKNAKK